MKAEVIYRESLIHLDNAIQKVDNAGIEEVQLLDFAIKKFYRLFGYDSTLEDGFQSISKPVERNLLIGTILRLIGNNERLFWEHISFRVKALKYILENFEELKALRIPEKDLNQNHLFIKHLQRLYNDFTFKFEDLKESIINVESVSKFPQKMFTLLKTPLYKPFIEGFIPSEFLQPDRINQALEKVKSLNEFDEVVKQKNQSDLVYSLIRYIVEVKKSKTLIANIVIVQPFQKVIDILNANLSEEYKYRKATLNIVEIERKYPFYSKKIDFEVPFIIVNNGKVDAQSVQVKVINSHEHLEFDEQVLFLGEVVPGNIETSFRCKTIKGIGEESVRVMIRMSWIDFDGSLKKLDKAIVLKKQNTTINWNAKNPYSLESVKDEKSLIGRKELLNELLSNYNNEALESSIITGQKRVGKSSLSKTLQSILAKRKHFVTVFVEVGGLDKQTPEKFVTNLALSITEEILDALPPHISKQLEKPQFDGAISPLIRLLKKVNKLQPQLKFVIFIDEFDEIPVELIYPSPVGDTFFHNIRSLVQDNYVGLVLIGGENMQFIQQTTDRFNKFNLIAVDYFNKEKYLNDFYELITSPITNGIEVGPDALSIIYEFTEGNPFYTKMICKDLFMFALGNRIAYITKHHVQKICNDLIQKMEVIHINHFWKDNIVADDPSKKDNIETQRRKFLMGYAFLKRSNKVINEKSLNETPLLKNEIFVEKVFESFKNRNILIHENNDYRIKPRLINQWLVETGWQDISVSFINEDVTELYHIKDKELYIKDSELLELAEKWGSYKSKEISAPLIRDWLNQFEDNLEKRVFFFLLKNLKFYSEFEVRSKLKVIHKMVADELGEIKLKEGQKERNDILVTSLDKLGKSSSYYVRLYRSANGIDSRYFISANDISTAISANASIKAIILVNDIIGSGGSFINDLEYINERVGHLLSARGIKIFLTSVCGYFEGIQKIEEFKNTLPFDVQIIVPDIISEEETCKNINSIIYEDEVQAAEAIKLIKKYFSRLNLSKDFSAFGYRDTGLLVSFFETCPNNTIPIIWSESPGKWKPLLKR